MYKYLSLSLFLGLFLTSGGLLSKCLCPFVGVFCCSRYACGDVLLRMSECLCAAQHGPEYCGVLWMAHVYMV